MEFWGEEAGVTYFCGILGEGGGRNILLLNSGGMGAGVTYFCGILGGGGGRIILLWISGGGKAEWKHKERQLILTLDHNRRQGTLTHL